MKLFHQLCSRPPFTVLTAPFCISSSQLQCPEGGLRTFPLFAFPVLGIEGEIPDAVPYIISHEGHRSLSSPDTTSVCGKGCS